MRIELAELLRWMGLAGADAGRFDVALRSAEKALRLAQQRDDSGQRALSLNALAACFERMGDPWQAERLMREALALAEADGSDYVRVVTLNNLAALTIGAFHLLRGVAEGEARAALERSLGYAERAMALLQPESDPIFLVFLEGNLGEVLLHLGQAERATSHLQRALSSAGHLGAAGQVWRIRCTLAEEHLSCGRAAQARDDLQRVLAEAAEKLPQATALRLHHGLYLACRALGESDQALAHLEHHDHLLRERAARQLRAQSELMVTRLEVERARLETQTERARAVAAAAHASQDALTGLGNRRHVDAHLPGLLRQADDPDQPLVMALVDIDHFKLINDRHGHRCGDQVLVALAQMLRENTRSADLLARIGGEEFLIALPDTPPERAHEVCERLRERVAAHAWHGLSADLAVTISVGLAHTPPAHAEALFERADQALYRAKQAGRNRVHA